MKYSKIYALLIGIVCHVIFIISISLMGYMLFWGMSRSIYPIGGTVGRIVNLALLSQFPILHSFFLTNQGRRYLAKIHPFNLGQDLISTSFVILASLQLLVTFVFWTPSLHVWFVPEHKLFWVEIVFYVSSWMFLVKAILDSGASLQTGLLGWLAVFKGNKPTYPRFSTEGLFKRCRQPIYLGFLLILLTAPVWTFDHLIFVLTWGAYCIIGPLLKEKRLLAWHGDSYRQYQNRVRYFIPF